MENIAFLESGAWYKTMPALMLSVSAKRDVSMVYSKQNERKLRLLVAIASYSEKNIEFPNFLGLIPGVTCKGWAD